MSHPISRRTFLGAAASSVALTTTGAPSRATGRRGPRTPERRAGWIDVNVWLGQWPLRRIEGDTPRALVAHLRARGVTRAWAGSFEGVLHKNLDAANARLAEACGRSDRGLLVPFGTVNPAFPDWEEDLRRCAETHGMAGIRVLPGYHGYRLDDPRLGRLFELATQAGLIVQLVVLMEDERMMHPLFRVPVPDLGPLPSVLAAAPTGLRLMLLNGLKAVHPVLIRKLVDTGRVHVEISALEGVGGLETLLRQVPADRVLFGSQAPFLYFESAALKLQESELSPAQDEAIRRGNAIRLLAGGRTARSAR